MTRNLRSHGKNTVVWVLMGMLVLGLGGFGVSNFSGGGARSIGAVGGTEVGVNDYARALRAQIDGVARQMGKRPTMAEMQQMGLDRAVQSQLFAGAALTESARKLGLSAGDEEVRQQILQIPAFQNMQGQFDRSLYADALKREGLSEAEFESRLRSDSAQGLVQTAVTGAIAAPKAMVDSYTAWLTETRDLSWITLSPGDLPAPLPAPTAEELTTYHQTHAEEFTRPETRHITYVLLTPEMMAGGAKLDEEVLKQLYQKRIDEFQRPERRLVEVLVYPDAAAAADARARLDAGSASFADLAGERGLTLSDIDRGEVTEADLGAAGPAVFAPADNGVVGPVGTDLGPALVSVNAILAPIDISFEDAREELSGEAATDQAGRDIADLSGDLEDRLAGGATLEDMAGETPMQLAQIALTADSTDGAAAYPEFREAALKVTADDFPALIHLNDGGVAALRLDSIDAPALIPLDDIREQVSGAWTKSELTRRLATRAEEIAAAVEAGNSLTAQGFTPSSRQALGRDDFVEGAPAAVVTRGFELAAPGKAAEASDAEDVYVVVLNAVHPGGSGAEADSVREAFRTRLAQSLASDAFAYYARAVQAEAGLSIDPAIISAVNARVN